MHENGISIGDIFRIIFSQKWLMLILLVAITVAGTLGIYLGKNTVEETYNVSFTLELPQTGDNKKYENDSTNTKSPSYASVVYYPDGTPFYYTDIVSLATLRKVKNSSEAFESINVEQMSKDGDISISRSTFETANNSGAYESIYNLSVKASYFSSKDVARDFVVALTNTPIDYLRLMDIDYNVYINSAKTAPDYVTEISQLIAQSNYLIERYDAFVEIYNDLSIGGKTLRSYSQEIKSYLNNMLVLDILQTEVRKECYLKSEDLVERYKIEYDKLQRQHEIANYTLENLKAKGDSESISAEVFKNQSDLVIELKKQMEEIYFKNEETGEESGFMISKDYKGGEDYSEGHEKFIANLNEAYVQVQAFTDQFKDVVSSLYSKVSVVSYSNSNVVVTSGVTGLSMALAISLVAGLVISMIVAFIVGWCKKKKAAAVAAPEQLQIEFKQSNEE